MIREDDRSDNAAAKHSGRKGNSYPSFKRISGKILNFVVKGTSFVFCLTLGMLSIYVFSVAAIYLAKASGKITSDKLNNLFTAIGLVAVAAAVLDLSVTLYREMVMPEGEKRAPARVRGSLTRFIVIVIIAVLIEGLIMFFKFSEGSEIRLLPYACLAFGAAFLLLIGLALYIKITIPVEKLGQRDIGS